MPLSDGTTLKLYSAIGQHPAEELVNFIEDRTPNFDTINENTADAGVTVDGVLLKDTTVDVDGTADAIILDADADTTISAPTDDQIDVEIAGADDFTFTTNTFTALSGSSIATNTLAETTAGNGIVIDGAKVRDGIFIGAQAAPTAETAAATITIADILTGIVTLTQATGATVALTLDTGTAMDAGMPTGMGTDQYLDWYLINLSAAALDTGTLTADTGHTIVGVVLVPSLHITTGGLDGTNSAQLRSRRTAANTWVTYRLG